MASSRHRGYWGGSCYMYADWEHTGVCDARRGSENVTVLLSSFLHLLVMGLGKDHVTSLRILFHQCNSMIIMKIEDISGLLWNKQFFFFNLKLLAKFQANTRGYGNKLADLGYSIIFMIVFSSYSILAIGQSCAYSY